jgi:pentatricopeptide repeat protein
MGKRDVVSYSSVINVYSKMGGVDAAKRAQALLDEMQKEDVEPNAHTFNRYVHAASALSNYWFIDDSPLIVCLLTAQ